MTSASKQESVRWFGCMPGRAEDIGEIVHELELAGVRRTEGYEAIPRRRVLDLKHSLTLFPEKVNDVELLAPLPSLVSHTPTAWRPDAMAHGWHYHHA
jgi:hypothetical protein